jgi:hypothetical protein
MSEVQFPADSVHAVIGTPDQDVLTEQRETRNSDPFWAAIEAQLHELRSAQTVDEVIKILAQERNPYGPGVSSAPGFFAGSGGDDTVADALRAAGWRTVWSKASYFYCMRAPDGSCITYVEGDIYPGDHRPTETG